MVDWMQQVESHRSELRELHDLGYERWDARFGQFRAEVRQEIQVGAADVRELRAEFAGLREEMRAGFAGLREEMRAGSAGLESRLEAKFERRVSDLMKWSLTFWIGTTVTLVVALAALGRLFR